VEKNGKINLYQILNLTTIMTYKLKFHVNKIINGIIIQ